VKTLLIDFFLFIFLFFLDTYWLLHNDYVRTKRKLLYNVILQLREVMQRSKLQKILLFDNLPAYIMQVAKRSESSLGNFVLYNF
jgi:hypothetical protein